MLTGSPTFFYQCRCWWFKISVKDGWVKRYSLAPRRDETVPMVDWKPPNSEKECETNRSDRSFQSAHDSVTRDSGAGDSVISETDNTSEEKTQFIKQSIPLFYAPSSSAFSSTFGVRSSSSSSSPKNPKTMRKEPTFSTFVGDSDAESVSYVEYSNNYSITVK